MSSFVAVYGLFIIEEYRLKQELHDFRGKGDK